MTRWYESTDHMEDRAALLTERLGPEALARLHSVRPEFDPEERFTELVRQHLRAGDVVVDIGAGGGSWLMPNVALDPDVDAPLVDRIVAEHGGPDGVRLTVHRLRLVARKTG